MTGMYVRIEGLAAIETALDRMTNPALMKKTLTRASAAGAKIVRESMKGQLGSRKRGKFTGRGTGALQKSIRYRVMRRSTTQLVGHVVAPMGRFGSARALVEYGHGGPMPAPAHPFIQPAFDATEAAAMAAMEQYLFEAVKEF